jgi:putative transposase
VAPGPADDDLDTAADVHHGQAAAVRAGRARVLDAAYLAHPERFVSSWINPPKERETATE